MQKNELKQGRGVGKRRKKVEECGEEKEEVEGKRARGEGGWRGGELGEVEGSGGGFALDFEGDLLCGL